MWYDATISGRHRGTEGCHENFGQPYLGLRHTSGVRARLPGQRCDPHRPSGSFPEGHGHMPRPNPQNIQLWFSRVMVNVVVFCGDSLCVITARWSRGGSTVVSAHPPAASKYGIYAPCQVCGYCSRRLCTITVRGLASARGSGMPIIGAPSEKRPGFVGEEALNPRRPLQLRRSVGPLVS